MICWGRLWVKCFTNSEEWVGLVWLLGAHPAVLSLLWESTAGQGEKIGWKSSWVGIKTGNHSAAAIMSRADAIWVKATLKVPHSSLGRSGCSITPLQQNPFLFWGLCSFLEIEAVAQLQSTPVLQNRCPKGSVICIQHMLVCFPQKIWIWAHAFPD